MGLRRVGSTRTYNARSLAYPLLRLFFYLSFFQTMTSISKQDYGRTRGLGGGKGEGSFIFWERGALKYYKGTGEQAKSSSMTHSSSTYLRLRCIQKMLILLFFTLSR